jgi:hypothetical protein
MNLIRRIWHSPGVRQIGVPTAVAITLLKAFQEDGLTWTVLVTRRFWSNLGVSSMLTGILGGLFVEWFVAKIGMPMRTDANDQDRDHTA